MFELADRLVGIYKTDNCTKSVTINPHLIEETVPAQSQVANMTTVLGTPAKVASGGTGARSSVNTVQPLTENNSQSMEVV